MNIVISSGHGKYVRGASGVLDEVDEARAVVEGVAGFLREAGVSVTTYHDEVSRSQNENLHRIVDFHNSRTRDLDVSVHFNAYENTSKPMGTECLYVTQEALAGRVSAAISDASTLINRGAKYRGDLFFLNNTEEPAILIETCFVDSSADAALYREHFDSICKWIAATISGGEQPVPSPDDEPLFAAAGRCSWFGGPDDDGVSASEGLAFIYSYDQRPDLFLPQQPPGTTGLARRLNPEVPYCACRWDYSVTPKEMLADVGLQALVRANGRELRVWPADWGPNANTGRVCDLSPGAMDALGITTDDAVEIIYPLDAIEPAPPEPISPWPAVSIEITSSAPIVLTVNGMIIDVPAQED